MMKTILSRLAEPSTWAGLAGLAAAVGFSADEWSKIAAAIMGICGVLAMVLKEKAQ